MQLRVFKGIECYQINNTGPQPSMTFCILVGSGPIVQRAAEFVTEVQEGSHVLTRSEDVAELWKDVADVRVLPKWDPSHMLEFMKDKSVSQISFIGAFKMDGLQRIPTRQGPGESRLNAPAALTQFVDDITKSAIEIVPATQVIRAFAPNTPYPLRDPLGDEAKRAFYRGISELQRHATQERDGWTNACIVGPEEYCLIQQDGESTDGLIDRFQQETSRSAAHENVYLCKHSPWPHSVIRQPTIGTKTVKQCLLAGMRGIVADASQVIVVTGSEVSTEAKTCQMSVQYFNSEEQN